MVWNHKKAGVLFSAGYLYKLSQDKHVLQLTLYFINTYERETPQQEKNQRQNAGDLKIVSAPITTLGSVEVYHGLSLTQQ